MCIEKTRISGFVRAHEVPDNTASDCDQQAAGAVHASGTASRSQNVAYPDQYFLVCHRISGLFHIRYPAGINQYVLPWICIDSDQFGCVF